MHAMTQLSAGVLMC